LGWKRANVALCKNEFCKLQRDNKIEKMPRKPRNKDKHERDKEWRKSLAKQNIVLF
jgi:hypothetical protein